jgi:hypothetical protein
MKSIAVDRCARGWLLRCNDVQRMRKSKTAQAHGVFSRAPRARMLERARKRGMTLSVQSPPRHAGQGSRNVAAPRVCACRRC